MNYRLTAYILGQIAVITAAFMLVPFAMTFGYGEYEYNTPLAFGVTIGVLLLVGIPCVVLKPKDSSIRARGGFVIVALAWICMSVFGALPFRINGAIPNFIDCLFETVSGFTTTGASIIPNVEIMPKSLLFWRSMTHWIGGMGVLVFVIAVLPKSNPAIVHLLKAEVPGPQFGKIVSKLRFTARILYGIYIVLTALEVVLLVIDKNVDLFDSFIHAFGTAGTGGFSNYVDSVGHFDSVYVDVVITVFMMIFSMNFNLFYFILIGHVREALKSEELHWMLSIFVGATLALTVCLLVNNVYSTFAEALRYSAFQASTIMSTTGFATADFATWPTFAQFVLVLLMFIGGSAGSTAGGLKVSRVIILFKNGIRNFKKACSPRSFNTVRLDGKPVSDELSHSVSSYFIVYITIFVASCLLVSVVEHATFDFTTHISAVASCLNNVGPGLGAVGPLYSYADYSIFSKIVLTVDMLLGRLEVVPLLLLFYPKVWSPAK